MRDGENDELPGAEGSSPPAGPDDPPRELTAEEEQALRDAARDNSAWAKRKLSERGLHQEEDGER